MRPVPSSARILALSSHPSTPTDVVRTLEVHVESIAGGSVELRYVLEAPLDRLRIPPARTATRRDELWKHTCFEVFVAASADGPYRELNFAPSSEWALYSFDDYRKGMVAPEAKAPSVSVQSSAQRLTLEVSADSGLAAVCRLALSAVIEDGDGRLSYWALRHPPGKPDFHHPESFLSL
jgi:hypothetical protein